MGSRVDRGDWLKMGRARARPQVAVAPGGGAVPAVTLPPLTLGARDGDIRLAGPHSNHRVASRRQETSVSYVIAEPCINTKDRACVDVCPVDCIYEDEKMLYIHPDECIDCGACEPECPVTAIFPEEDVPDQWKEFIALNKDIFTSDTPPGKPQKK
jgi:ferredoxin